MKFPKSLLKFAAAPLLASAVLLNGAMYSPTYAMGIEAKALVEHECNSTEWHFVITQVKDQASAPASITVTFENGKTEVVSLSKFSPDKEGARGVAHYTIKKYLDSAVESATANIYDGWSGEFNLSHGPCGANQQIPFAPLAVLYPAIGAATFGTAYGIRKLRRR